MTDDKDILTGTALEEDAAVEPKLRPQTLAEYIGQTKIRENLGVFLSAARGRGEPLDHVLLTGPPGLGKTTLAHIVAREMGAGLRLTSGPMIVRAGDLAGILTNLQPRDVLFVDEIHRLSPAVEEILYPAMEDYRLDVLIGEGPMARTMKVELPPFTLIGATTRPGLLSQPLHARFGITLRLDFYDVAALAQIVRRSADILGIRVDEGAAREIGGRSRGTPRIANRLLRRLRDFAEVGGKRVDRPRDGAGGADAAGGGRARLRRARPPNPDDHHRQVRRRAGRRRLDRRLARRGPRHARGPLRALSDPGGLSPAYPAGPRGVGRGLPPPGDHSAAPGRVAVLSRPLFPQPVESPTPRSSESAVERASRLPAFKKGVLIYNPTAGQRDLRPLMDALIERMRARGLTLVNAPTTGPGHATEIVRAFLPLKPDVVAACGGDGTISEVAQGLSGSGIPLAVLPGGTSNVLARELGIPLDPDLAAALLFDRKDPGRPACCSPTTGRSCSGPESAWTPASWAT